MLLVVFFAVAGVVFSAGRSIGGFTGTLLIVVSVIALLKGLLFAQGKVSDKVLDWWGNQPTWVYRIAAAALVALGCLTQWIMHASAN